MPSKEGDAVLPEAIIDAEMQCNFKLGAKDEAREHCRFYVDGLMIGLRDKVEAWLGKLQESSVVVRRKNPIPIKQGLEWFSLRKQREIKWGPRLFDFLGFRLVLSPFP